VRGEGVPGHVGEERGGRGGAGGVREVRNG